MENKSAVPVFANGKAGECINSIRLLADCSAADSPRDERTKSMPAFRSGDSVGFEITLLCGGAPADCSDIAKAEFEILDIGEINSPLPRTPKLKAKKSVAAADINTDLSDDDFAAGECHFKIGLSPSESSVGGGHKYLRICAYDSSGGRTTFAAGWICVGESFEPELGDTPEASVSKAAELEAEIAVHSAKISAVETSLAEISTDVSSVQGRLSAVESSKVSKGSSLDHYGITDAYTKNQTDSLLDNYKSQAQVEFSAYKTQTDTAVAAVSGRVSSLETLAEMSARCRQNAGVLRIGESGGSFSTAGNPIGAALARSYCITLHFERDFSVAQWNANTSINVIGDFDYANQLYRGIAYRITATNCFLTAGKTTSGAVSLTGRKGLHEIFGGNSSTTIPAGIYALVATVDITDAYVNSKIYVNGVLKDSNLSTQLTADIFSAGTKFAVCDVGNFHGSDFSKGCFSGGISRVAVFNFDMSSETAPYTVADYQNAKPIPPALCSSTAMYRALLAFDNYTFGGKIRDISGNGNHAAVNGDVAGDSDQSIMQMYEAFSYQYTQENP